MTAADLSERQLAALRLLVKHHAPHTNQIGFALKRAGHIKAAGLQGGNLVLAAESVMRSLERRGLVAQTRSDRSQWAVKVWYLTAAGKELIEAAS